MNAKNLTLNLKESTMHVIQFGKGENHLIMIPGLGDGLASIKGLAIPFSLLYRDYAKKYRVTVVSAKNQMKDCITTKEMAKDIIEAMDLLKINQADVLGISQGGMTAQHLALDYPQRIRKLVLAVTASRCNPLLASCIDRWINMVQTDDYVSFMKDNLLSMYTKEYCRRNLWMVQITGRMKPKSFDRFLKMAEACKTHNTYEHLDQIGCPVLVIAGEDDQVVGKDASIEIAEKIPQAKLIIYPDVGHAAYEEAKDFHRCVLDFLQID